MSNQPIINSTDGVILTVGIMCNGERLAIVEPYGFDSGAGDPITLCSDLVLSWESAALTAFLDCLSIDAAIVYLSADGMVDGRIPHREDFGPTTNPGTQTGASMPNNVTGLLTYYEDPADSVAGNRIRLGKTFMPGVPTTAVTADMVSGALQILYTTYGNIVQQGFVSASLPANKWWRLLATPKPRNPPQQIRRTINALPRGYVCTQKRRLIPR